MQTLTTTPSHDLYRRPGRLVRALGGVGRLTMIVVIAGLLWRLGRFALGFPIWGDEAFVAGSLLVRDFADLVRPPLEYNQIAPLGFMWAELAVSRLLGLNEWSLRLIALISGLAGFLLFVRFARRTLDSRSALLGVAIMAASFYLVRHANELKPYAGDMLVSLGLTYLAWAAARRPDKPALWVGLILVAALGVWFSYPAVFIVGGVGIFLLWRAIKTRSPGMAVGLVTLAVIAVASFAAMYVLYTGPASGHQANAHYFQSKSQLDASFPPFAHPLRIPFWLLDVHTGNMLAYPFGGSHFASIGTTLLVITGIVTFWRKGRRDFLLLLFAPLGLAFLAACLRKYPYGISARTMLFMAPAFCLLAGVGLASLIRLLPRAMQSMAIRCTVIALAVVAVGALAMECVWPYKDLCYAQTRSSVRQLADQTRPGDQWVVANSLVSALDAPWSLGQSGPVLNGRGGPTIRYYLHATAPVPVRWGLAPEDVQPCGGRTWVLCYSDPGFDTERDCRLACQRILEAVQSAMPRFAAAPTGPIVLPKPAFGRQEWHENFIRAMTDRFGKPITKTFEIQREEKNGNNTFLRAYIFSSPADAAAGR